mmetsp:Transcript_9883/g.20089  ORF Transcript_9883/g.20089 Transcript_9883/m.20089 type:complete len:208 (-) Transcript_9883:94-717(-)
MRAAVCGQLCTIVFMFLSTALVSLSGDECFEVCSSPLTTASQPSTATSSTSSNAPWAGSPLDCRARLWCSFSSSSPSSLPPPRSSPSPRHSTHRQPRPSQQVWPCARTTNNNWGGKQRHQTNQTNHSLNQTNHSLTEASHSLTEPGQPPLLSSLRTCIKRRISGTGRAAFCGCPPPQPIQYPYGYVGPLAQWQLEWRGLVRSCLLHR